ncbi:MAG: fatty acid desaturase [Candidatus Eremiobacteraeota bacterium]|nr:fatty acid desaturase [Candidatus Eremiobacteraeota bacterium]MBV9648023.1 fatty acid desaturase [Candidatus Eremiobacteraeota bacterium]
MKKERSKQRDVATGMALLLIHAGALAAFVPAFFSWSGVGLVFLLWWITGGIGVTLGYHRLITHRSLRVPRLCEYAIATLGTLALQGSPIEWIATHRAHHANSDRDGDPHDVHRGLPWAHMEWLYRANAARLSPAERRHYAPDLVDDPFYRALEVLAIPLQVALGVVLLILGGWSWVVWGIFVRLVFTYHCTWFVNSAAHATGYRTFRTGDRSTNCWWVALLSFGEGWHNNHHAFQFSARHGLRWFEFDMTWLTIRFLRAIRLARDVKLPSPQMMERLRLRGRQTRGVSA